MNKQRLFNYFEGKATAIEIKQIEEWSRDPAHQEQFYDWLDEWEQSHLQYNAEKEQSLQRYHYFLFNQEPRHHKTSADCTNTDSVSGPLFPRWRSLGIWMVAAMLLLVAGLSIFQDQLLLTSYDTAYGETRSLTLPDGSAVTLNANSSLTVPRFGFGNRTRQVTLRGEALFSVVHQKNNQRFIVKTANGADVVVLGTEFTVFARPRGTKVALNRGKVQLRYQHPGKQPHQLMMKPGDVVALTPKGEMRQQHVEAIPETRTEWANRQHKFNKTPLTEIIAMLSENYGLAIELADAEAGQLTLSGIYTAESGDELLRIVAEVLDLDVQHLTDKKLVIRKPIQ